MGLLMFVMSGFGFVFGEAAADRADAEHIAAYATQVPGGTTPLGSNNFRKYWLGILSTRTHLRSTM